MVMSLQSYRASLLNLSICVLPALHIGASETMAFRPRCGLAIVKLIIPRGVSISGGMKPSGLKVVIRIMDLLLLEPEHQKQGYQA